MRAKFEELGRDLELDLSCDSRGNYKNNITRIAYLTWSKALESKEELLSDQEPVLVDLEDIITGQLYFNWSQKKCGFGQLSIGKNPETGEVTCMNEAMGRRWVRRALHAAIDKLVDNAKLDIE